MKSRQDAVLLGLAALIHLCAVEAGAGARSLEGMFPTAPLGAPVPVLSVGVELPSAPLSPLPGLPAESCPWPEVLPALPALGRLPSAMAAPDGPSYKKAAPGSRGELERAAAAAQAPNGPADKSSGEGQAASASPAFDGAGDAPNAVPAAAEAAAPAPAPAAPAVSQARFRELVASLHAFTPLLPTGLDRPTPRQLADAEVNRRDLQAVVDAALRRKDVMLLAQLGLLAGARSDPQTRDLFYRAVYSLELSNLLSYGKPGDYQIGLDAKKARATLDRHSWIALRPIVEDGRERDPRDWLRERVLARFAEAY